MKKLIKGAIFMIACIGITFASYGSGDCTAEYDVEDQVVPIGNEAIDGNFSFDTDIPYDYEEITGDDTFTEDCTTAGEYTYTADVTLYAYGEDDEPDEEVGYATATVTITVVEVTEIEPADDKEFVALDETLTKEDFDITTDPEDKEGESFLTVAPLTFSATGEQTITATCGTSSETCTLTAVDVEISLIP